MRTVGFRSQGRRRSSNEPSEQVSRIVWMLCEFQERGELDYLRYSDRCGRTVREFQRDIAKIRRLIGDRMTILPAQNGRALAVGPGGRPFSPLVTADRDAKATLMRLIQALGGAAEREARVAVGDEPADMGSGFLHMHELQPAASERVIGV